MPRRLENDRWLFIVTLALCLLGAVMIFSASAVTAEHEYGHSYIFLLRQAAWLGIGLAGMFVLMRTDYRRLREPAVVYAVLCAVGLMLVGAFFLDKSHATHRWIRFGPIGIQPSELAKLAVILYLAWFLDLKRRSAASMEFRKDDFLHNILPAIGPILVCVALILAQPDLGTSVDIVLIAAAVLYVAGLSWKWIAVGAAVSVPALYLLITHVAYRQARMMAFLNPDSDPQGAGFQLLQSLIAVGSGGFTGVGLMESKQKLFYLPEAHTDFIYAVICEELGFIGALVVITLFVIYGWRGLRAAFSAPDSFGRLLALGITAMVMFQTLINFAVVLGMVPTKGIPLPFISYGGSSLLVMLLATGVLLNISQQATNR
ncbi:MAG TPA: putative lipid II flippase FtsW [Candidatus Eisenbacteria bacterium]|jgi:cell division protein FtsW|nr:putative lipid II flippase FtsW [Candidatus Eisenbacteria bacterium]